MWGDEDHIKKLKEAEEWPAPSEMPKGRKKKPGLDAPDEMAKKVPRHAQRLIGNGLPSRPFAPQGVPWVTVLIALSILAAALAVAILVD